LGIDLPGEASGFIPSIEWKNTELEEPWYIGDTYNTSIGQGYFLTTPLQIASMTAVVANRGVLYRPRIVTHIIDALTEEETAVPPEIIEQSTIDSIHFDTVAAGMYDCVQYGSCVRLRSLPFSVAGKTGTAQWHGEKENHAWFTSFAPYENPEIVLTVLVEEGGGGTDIAVPIAHSFYQWWWSYKNSIVD
jgi:penicillin-binding protein 2